MHIFGQKFILISLARSQKNEIEKWPLITLFQCKIVLGISHLNAQMMTGVPVIVHFSFVYLEN